MVRILVTALLSHLVRMLRDRGDYLVRSLRGSFARALPMAAVAYSLHPVR
jgi:hypothetical protein